jgi:hypothetical protein
MGKTQTNISRHGPVKLQSTDKGDSQEW